MIGFWKKRKPGNFHRKFWKKEKKSSTKIRREDGTRSIPFPVEEKIDPQELKWSLHEQETLALVLLDLQKFREKPLDEQAIYNIKTILYFFASHKKM